MNIINTLKPEERLPVRLKHILPTDKKERKHSEQYRYYMFTLIDSFNKYDIAAGYSSDYEGHWRYNEPPDIENYDRLGSYFSISHKQMIRIKQGHTDRIFEAKAHHGGMGIDRGGEAQCGSNSGHRDGGSIKEYDALATCEKDLMLCIVTADCTPVFMLDPVHRAIALVHSGRKGTLLGICKKTVEHLQKAHGTDPRDLICALGPYICGEHHIIQKDDIGSVLCGDSLAKHSAYINLKDNVYHVDLGKGIKLSLEDTGVQSENILDLNICTFEESSLFSWRRDHIKGSHNLSFIMMR